MPTDAPAAAKPTKVIFDPFNSSSTGHQRADNQLTGTTAWRDSRSRKLQEQFAADAGGGKRISDRIGAGSLDFGQDGRLANGRWEKGAKGLRTGGQRSLWESMAISKCREEPGVADKHSSAKPKDDKVRTTRTELVNPFTPFRYGDGRVRESSWTAHETSPSELLEPFSPVGGPTEDPISPSAVAAPSPFGEVPDATVPSAASNQKHDSDQTRPPQIFANLTFYINGSTAPYSDHNIKRLLSSHGGRISVSLGRRTVTHVILGRANNGGGCGGGLAGSKIHKEISRIAGKAVRYVTADWIVESVKAGKRQPESRYEPLKLAPKGVGSVTSMFKAKD